MDLTGRRAVVTGVTSGIGAALAARLVGAGAEVVGVGRDRARLDATAGAVGPSFRPLLVDLADPVDRARGAAALRDLGALDVFVGNAAECVYAAPTALPIEHYRRIFEVNVLAPIELVQALAPGLAAGGHVVLVSSVTARHLPGHRFGPYAATKAALDAYAAALRIELEGRATVTTVVPGLVDTPLYDKVQGFERTLARIKEQTAEWLRPEDVAEAVLWALARPARVAINEITIVPRGQSR
jgi:NAD(P)-dependent dehydrogenase (short-subunit alcohol dehydrogenase family)